MRRSSGLQKGNRREGARSPRSTRQRQRDTKVEDEVEKGQSGRSRIGSQAEIYKRWDYTVRVFQLQGSA